MPRQNRIPFGIPSLSYGAFNTTSASVDGNASTASVYCDRSPPHETIFSPTHDDFHMESIVQIAPLNIAKSDSITPIVPHNVANAIAILPIAPITIAKPAGIPPSTPPRITKSGVNPVTPLKITKLAGIPLTITKSANANIPRRQYTTLIKSPSNDNTRGRPRLPPSPAPKLVLRDPTSLKNGCTLSDLCPRCDYLYIIPPKEDHRICVCRSDSGFHDNLRFPPPSPSTTESNISDRLRFTPPPPSITDSNYSDLLRSTTPSPTRSERAKNEHIDENARRRLTKLAAENKLAELAIPLPSPAQQPVFTDPHKTSKIPCRSVSSSTSPGSNVGDKRLVKKEKVLVSSREVDHRMLEEVLKDGGAGMHGRRGWRIWDLRH